MARTIHDDGIESNRICFQCIGDAYLKNEIKKTGQHRKCNYCGIPGRTYTLIQLADRVESAFDIHYDQTADYPDEWQSRMLADPESAYEWEREGDDVITALRDAASISEEIAKDVHEILEGRYSSQDAYFAGEETMFQSGSYFQRKTVRAYDWDKDWREFEEALKTKERYFSRTAANLLNRVFDGVAGMKTWNKKQIITEVGPGTTLSHFFRARVFQSEHELSEALKYPEWQIGPPPAARTAGGRMNAAGIAAFYGANVPELAIAEVRPPVGSFVVVAKFDLLRSIRLLDLTAFQHIKAEGSVFDPAFAAYFEKLAFLSQLQQLMTRPVMPNDEVLEYLPTQAVADFLSVHPELNLDGIIYPSVQSKGTDFNCVLFHKCSRVKRIDIKAGTQIKATLRTYEEHQSYTSYEVTELIPADQEPTADEKEAARFATMIPIIDGDKRTPALMIDLEAIHVHAVQSVQVNTTAHRVRRHQRPFLHEEDLYDY
ncbi:RES family NAD+ phosphorylase [Mucilaginibacter angelicae]|uniref:RES family NAD+ phosphorylase n=1 Tax=Mucilaginibacter angelicae TaxID=869718 RepID=A0ABV6L4W8_9SPHI